MPTCIGKYCYDLITKDKILYYIRSNITHNLDEDSSEHDLTRMSDYVFNTIKNRSGVDEILLQPKT
jgi:hypothetical protein